MRTQNKHGFVAVFAILTVSIGACGESESSSDSSTTATTASGGSGGSGGEPGTEPQSMMCDGTLCEGLTLGIPGGPQTDACCPEDSPNEPCGVKTDFLEEYDVSLMRDCQPLHSPGEYDPECPASPPIMANSLSLPGFPGCCLPSGKCGFLLDEALLGAVQLNLGCLDSRELPNPDFEDPPDCDPGDPGTAGAGGSP